MQKMPLAFNLQVAALALCLLLSHLHADNAGLNLPPQAPANPVQHVPPTVSMPSPKPDTAPIFIPNTKPVELIQIDNRPPGCANIPGIGLPRGLFSIIQSPIEIIRISKWTVVDSFEQKPAVGVIITPVSIPMGCIAGSIGMLVRILQGSLDMLTIGYLGETLYTPNFPPFIWDATWNLKQLKK